MILIMLWIALTLGKAITQDKIFTIRGFLILPFLLMIPYLIKKLGLFSLLAFGVFCFWLPVSVGFKYYFPLFGTLYPLELVCYSLILYIITNNIVYPNDRFKYVMKNFPLAISSALEIYPDELTVMEKIKKALPSLDFGVLEQIKELRDSSANNMETVREVLGKMITLVVEFAIKPGMAEAHRAVSARMRTHVEREEPGTTRYDWWLSDDGTRGINIEIFEDSDALVHHMASTAPLVADLVANAEVVRVEVLGELTHAGRVAIDEAATGYFSLLGGIAR